MATPDSNVAQTLFANTFKAAAEGEEELPPPPVSREVKASEVFSFVPFETEPIVLDDSFTLLKGKPLQGNTFGCSDTDLIPGKYEGGRKLWECSIDLVDALRSDMRDGCLVFRGKDVLDLGCGHGLLGILALIKGAKKVHFQDFNEQVLTDLTIPNVDANLRARKGSSASSSPASRSETRFFAGDWDDLSTFIPTAASVDKKIERASSLDMASSKSSVSEKRHLVHFSEAAEAATSSAKFLLPRPRSFRSGDDSEEAEVGCYDIILTSETVYSLRSMPKLLNIIKQTLRRPYGVVYLAGKKHYFGVGGGTQQFQSLVEEDGLLQSHLLKEYVDGSSNVREVWKFYI